MRKEIISTLLAASMLFSAFPVFAENTDNSITVEADGVVTNGEKQIIVINGVEYDVTGWSSEDIDALRQTNISGSGVETGDASLNDKFKPDYDINKFFEMGWSSEEAGVIDRTPGGMAAEELSEYEGSLRLMLGLGVLNRINGKAAAKEVFTEEDFKRVVKIIGAGAALSGYQPEYGEAVTGNDLVDYLAYILGYTGIGSAMERECRNEITEDIDADLSKEISRETASQLIRTAMGMNTVKLTIVGDGKEAKPEGKTIFEKMEIIGITGWVNANHEENIFGGEATVQEGYIEINNARCTVADSEYARYIGKYVDAYVFDDEYTVISMTENKLKGNAGVELIPDDIENISLNTITYTNETGRSKTLKVASSTRIIKNGENVGTLSGNPVDLNLCDSITLYDIDNDERYDYIVVTDTVNYLVDKVQNGILLTNNYADTLDYTEAENLTVYIDGVKSSLDKIAAGNVVSVAENKHPAIKLYVSTKNDEGVIKEVSAANGIRIEGDDTFYPLSPDYAGNIIIGLYCQVFYDYTGKVAFVRETVSGGPTATGRRYAFLVRSSASEAQEAAFFRMGIIGQQEISWQTMTVKGKLTLQNGNDGKKIKKDAIEIATLPELQTPKLVVYETDTYGNLTKIITAQDISNDPEMPIDEEVFQLQKKYTGTNKVRMYWQGFFSGDFAWNNKSVAISVPNDWREEESYAYISGRMGHTEWQNVEVYDASSDRNLNGIILRLEENSNVQAFNKPKVIVVAEAQTVYDEASESLRVVVKAADGTEYWTDDLDREIGLHSVIPEEKDRREPVKKLSEVKPGDILRIEANSKDKISLFAVEIRLSDFDVETMPLFFFSTYYNRVGSNGMDTGFRHGKVILNGSSADSIMVEMQKRDDNGTEYDYTDDKIIPAAVQLMYAGQVCKFWEYDRSSKTVRKITRNEILPGDHVVQWADTWYISSQMVKIVD